MTDIAAMVNVERRVLLGELEALNDDQWSVMTACEPWTIRHVVAHLTFVGNSSGPGFFGGLIRSGFNFDRFTGRGVEIYNTGSNADLMAGFADTVESSKGPPGPKYILLGEIMCHREDIRRALRRRGEYREEHLATLAGKYRRSPAPIGGWKRSKGLRLIATDADWSAGDGPEVIGPAMDLILAMTGRRDALDGCTGDGVEILRSRS